MHHQGDVGSASFHAANILLCYYRKTKTFSSDLIGFIFALNDRITIHDSIDEYLPEYNRLKYEYLHWCIDNLNTITDFMDVKYLLAVMAQEAKQKELVSLLDCIDKDQIDEYLNS